MPALRTGVVSLFALLLAFSPAHAGGALKMFVTSIMGTSNLSSWDPYDQGLTGLAAADAVCQTLAHDNGLDNWSAFRAWLSTDTQDAYCRVAGFSGRKADDCGELGLPDGGPWERVDGKPFAVSLSDLAARNYPLHAPSIDETGELVDDAFAHTGTENNGAAEAGANCQGWVGGASGSGQIGKTSAGGAWWTSNGVSDCESFAEHLFCFESGTGGSLPDWERPGALVFATSASGNGDLGAWDEAGAATGLGAGDAICRALAGEAGLPSPDSFVAWLSSSSVDAIDRVTIAGPFKRVDGIEIAASRADLVDLELGVATLAAAPLLDEGGVARSQQAWTGSDENGERTASHCTNWTSGGAGGTQGFFGYLQETSVGWNTAQSPGACSASKRLYCFSNRVTIFWDGFESANPARWSNY